MGILQRITGGALARPTSVRLKQYYSPMELASIDILGADNVIGYRDATRVWGLEIPAAVPSFPYAEEDLRACAEENKRGCNWRLIWTHGFSFRQQDQILGRNRKKQPCFHPDIARLLNGTCRQEKGRLMLDYIYYDPISDLTVKAGYRLLDFRGRFPGGRWILQEDAIKNLGISYQRTEEQVVTEACFSVYMVTKRRLLRNWCHYGQRHLGSHVSVGFFGSNGIHVEPIWDYGCNSRLRVVISLTPDHRSLIFNPPTGGLVFSSPTGELVR